MVVWLDAMKQWGQWLMGDAPMPDNRSRAVLAGTVATATVVAFGVPAILPSTTVASATGSSAASASQTNDTYPANHASSPIASQGGGNTTTRSTVAFNILTPPAPSAKGTYAFNTPPAQSIKGTYSFDTPPAPSIKGSYAFNTNPVAGATGRHANDPFYYFATAPTAQGGRMALICAVILAAILALLLDL